MLISPTEPFIIKALGKVSSVPENYGADILFVAGKNGRTGVQRKKFPEDLLSSLADGRLYDQVHKMAQLDRGVFVMEGFGQWTSDGELVDQHVTGFRKEHLYALYFSLTFEFGLQVLTVRGINETCAILTTLEDWLKKDRHTSLRTRPSAQKDSWGQRGNREYAAHLLQSFPGVGPELAFRMFDHFGRAPIKWDLNDMKDLQAVPGIGKEKAKKMWEVLNG